MIFNFSYRDEFSISCRAANEEDARKCIVYGVGEMKIENLGNLWEEYLELDGEYEDNEEI